MRKSSVAWLIISVLSIFGARVWSLYENAQEKFIQITLRSSVTGIAQIYYDLGKGLSEKNSVRNGVSNNVSFDEYLFRIPNVKIHGLRFDPLMSGGRVEIRQISIVDGLGNEFKKFDLNQFRPIQQIDRFVVDPRQISMDMSTDNDDPQIEISMSEPLLLDRSHKSFLPRQMLDFLLIAFAACLLYFWANWRDARHIKRWIYCGLIVVGSVVVIFYFLQTIMGIQHKTILPVDAGDTTVFLYMVGQKWTSPNFYIGLRPWTVPLLYSLVGVAKNTYNIILLQVVVSYISWMFLALVCVFCLKDLLVKIIAFFAIAFIPLNLFIHGWNLTILSESLSFSLLAFFVGSFFLYYQKRSLSSVILVGVAALLFAFTRDTNAYLVLLMMIPVAVIFGEQVRKKKPGAARHLILFCFFLFLFVGSTVSASHIRCDDSDICNVPYTNARWYFPFLNLMGQRILPEGERLQFFADRGLQVTPALMAMQGKFASSDNWRWYRDPQLADHREWLYRHGKSTYMKYLIAHPDYVFQSALHEKAGLLFLSGQPDAWFHKMLKPLDLEFLSVFFLNRDHDLRFFTKLFTLFIVFLSIRAFNNRHQPLESSVRTMPFIVYILLASIPHGLLCYHGDAMDVARHAYTHVILLNLGFVLFYLFLLDFLMSRLGFLQQRFGGLSHEESNLGWMWRGPKD